MKKNIILPSLFGLLCLSSSAVQAEVSLSLGYMHTKMDNSNSSYDYFGERLSTSLNGVNIKAGYNHDASHLGVMSSFSYSRKSNDRTYRFAGRRYKESLTQDYSSIMIGPSYKMTKAITPYILLGAAFNGYSYDYEDRWGYYDDSDDTKTAFAYGAGVQVKVASLNSGETNKVGLLLDFSYERAEFSNNPTNSFVIGAGISF